MRIAQAVSASIDCSSASNQYRETLALFSSLPDSAVRFQADSAKVAACVRHSAAGCYSCVFRGCAGTELIVICRPSSSAPATAPAEEQAPARHPVDLLNPVNRPQAAKIERGGAAVTLEVSEPLFQIAAALNACGYDADLDKSASVRAAVRADMNAALAASEDARKSRDQLCAYISKHHLNDMGLDVGQYVSLALYLSPPPELTPNVDLTQLPPQAAAVVNVLPLLRTFADDIELHYLWVKHRPEYEALTARVHDPMTDMILATNLFLHQPVSTFTGRRFLVLLEPMLSPNLTNARVYGADYIIVMSPDNSTSGDPVSMAQIRHIYLHYVVEPLVYSRGTAMERMQPLLETVQEAPLEFFYKSDIVALMSESVIKAIEAHMYVIPDPAPKKARGARSREDDANYDIEKAAYDAKTNVARDELVTLDERQGWVLTRYFYNGLTTMQHNGDGLKDEMAPLIYGMDVQRQKKAAQQILFVKSIPPDPLREEAAPHKIEGMELGRARPAEGR